MKKINVKHGMWILIAITSIAGAFLTKEGIYTKLNKEIQGGITIPSFLLPVIAIVCIFLVEQLRKRYPDSYVNAGLGFVWILLAVLIRANM